MLEITLKQVKAQIDASIPRHVTLGWRTAVVGGMALYAGVVVWLGAAWSDDTPLAGICAAALIVAFMLVGSAITYRSRQLWHAVHTIDNARLALQDQVEAQAKIQHELTESQQRMTALLDHSPMSVLIFDKDSGRLHYANRHALQTHGAHIAQELEQQCLFTQAPYSARDMRQCISQARETGSQELPWRSQRLTGEPIWWSIKLDMLMIDGVQYVVSFGHDITKRLEAEQALIDHRAHLEEQVRARTGEVLIQQHRLEAVIEALPVSLTIKDKEGRYQLSNKLFEEACGLSKDVLLGHSAEELFPPAMADQIREHDDALLNGMKMVRYENSRMRRDGTRKDHLVTKVPLLDTQGTPEAILTLAVDISDQKNMQRELAAAKNEAERLATVKSEFLANMSHEIRTPLHGVLGLVQLGQKLPAGDPQMQLVLDRITRSGRHLQGVINDILDFSKIDAGKLIVDQCALDPRQVAEDAVAMVEDRARMKGLRLALQCDTTPAAVLGDPLRIRQILINLLSNGVKFTQQGGVTLTLSAQHEQLYFSIRDTGIGMHPDMQERVFSPFEQADGSTSRRFGGTGLGLSISRKLALLMGGDIRLHSVVGDGATFTLVLPLQPADRALLPTPSETARSQAVDTSVPRLTGLRILAADDVDINRDIVSGLLTQQQATVRCAEDGQQAMQMLKDMGPDYFDIVLMDVQMPVMNGLQATELIHTIDPTVPVVALTAHALAEERQRCTQAGMVGHLAKPFEVEDMVRLILRHARRAPDAPIQATAETWPLPAAAGLDLAPSHIDLTGALRRCGGQDALLRKLVTRFSDEQADFAARCQQLLAQDPEQARRAVHMLKGTSANLGLAVLAQHAGELEDALIAQDAAHIGRALLALNLALKQHIALLRSWLTEQIPV